MSVDSLASSIASYQYQPTHSVTTSRFTDTARPTSAGTQGTSGQAKLTGSPRGLSSDLQNLLLQLQSGGGGASTTEAGTPTQSVRGAPHHNRHGGSQQAGGPGASQAAG